MVEKRKPIHFKVHYQLLGKTEKHTRDWLLSDLPETMRMLWKEETLTPVACEFMYIHEYSSDGKTKEVLAYEKPKDKLIEGPTSNSHKKGQHSNRPAAAADKLVETVKDVVESYRIHAINRYAFREAK